MSKIEGSRTNILKLEQYATDIDTAYEFTSEISSLIGIEDKNAADLGCGNGILGISLSLFGVKSVDMYDIDKNQIELASMNINLLGIKNVKAVEENIFDVKNRYDIIVSNPPFGFQSRFSTIAFVKHALRIGKSVFFIHKDNKEIRSIASNNDMSILELGGIKLKRSQNFHKKTYYSLPVVLVYKVEV